MTWNTTGVAGQSVTNEAWVKNGVLAKYMGDAVNAYKCAGDKYLSPAQRSAGFKTRLRSYAMNSFWGRFDPNNASDPTARGVNWGFQDHRQFLKLTDCPQPAKTWVTIDEHADSINDGYFINNPTAANWQDIPGSYHNGGCNFGFADGHSEIKKWRSNASRHDVRYVYAPKNFDAIARQQDFAWYLDNTGYVRIGR
jgi:prepilin-type processing-associated H-X9-DG protein